MQGHIIIKTGIKEATQMEEIVGSSSLGGLLDVKYVEKKVIMPQTARSDTQNLMQILLKHLQPALSVMTQQIGILIQEHLHI
jgi:hypothetical protein